MNPPGHDTIALMRRHRSIRQYTTAPVPDADIRTAVEAGQSASTSSAVQAYCLLRVTDDGERARLVELTGGQPQVAGCGAFFVVCGDTRRHRLVAERATRAYDTRLEAFMLAVIDASLFAQNLVLAFESMGYGVCYIGGLRNQLGAVADLLEIPHGIYPLYGLCVGVPDESPSARPRLPLDAVYFEGRLCDDERMRRLLDEYDASYRAYLEARDGAVRGDGAWSSIMAGKYTRPRRADLADVYTSLGANLS